MAILNNGLVPVHPLTLVPNYRAGTNIYLWNEERASTVKFLAGEQLVTEGVFGYFAANPHQQIFVAEACFESYRQHLLEHIDTWLAEPRVPRILKTTVTAECMHALLTNSYGQRSISELITTCIDCSERLVRYAPQIQINGRDLQRSLRHDSGFVCHAVNTAIYVYLITKTLGYGDDAIVEMCTGAMLHDVGKIHSGYLKSDSNKPFPASKDWTDRSTMTHPIDGFRRLCHQTQVTETHLMMCYQHHERIDGKGFPVGLLGNELHEASRICSVANRYDRLTSCRSNRVPITRLAALRVMESERNTLLDSEFFRCLDRIMSGPLTN
ncbi:MAG: HD domain-containing phosphohydrolase [Pirellula sp.]